MNEQNDKKLNRRQLLTRAGKAGISIAVAGTVSYLLYDAKGPKAGVEDEKRVTLKDFSIQHRPGQTMSIAKGPDRVKTVDKAIELLSGIERFVRQLKVSVFLPPTRMRTGCCDKFFGLLSVCLQQK